MRRRVFQRPGMRASPLPMASFTPWGEGQGEGQGRVRALRHRRVRLRDSNDRSNPSVLASAPHPNPLPIVKNDGEREVRDPAPCAGHAVAATDNS